MPFRRNTSQRLNREPYSGKHCYGKTPRQTFLEAKKIAAEKTIPAAYASDSEANLTSNA